MGPPQNHPRKSIFSASATEDVAFDNILSLCDKSANKFSATNANDIEMKGILGEPAETTEITTKSTKLPTSSAENDADAGTIFLRLSELLGEYQQQIARVAAFAPNYDPRVNVSNNNGKTFASNKPQVKANGYRTFVRVAASFVSILTEKLLSVGAKGAANVSDAELKDLSTLANSLDRLVVLNHFILEIHDLADGTNELFPADPDLRTERIEELSIKIGETDFSCFYGDICGFQYLGDCRRLAKPILMAMASYSDVFAGSMVSRLRKVTNALFGIRYTLDAEHLAQKVYHEIREQPIEFCKSFYNMAELDVLNRNRFGVNKHKEATIKANCVINLPPERLTITNTQGT